MKKQPNRAPDKAPSIDFAAIKAKAECLIVEILEEIAPDGELRGSEYLMYNPHRDDSELGSFAYNVDKHVYADFADDDVRGSDIIALTAFLMGITQLAAATKVLQIIEKIESEDHALHEAGPETSAAKPKRKRKPSKPPSTAIVPIPGDAPAPPSEHPGLGKPSAWYQYNDASGQTVCLIYRFDPPGEGKTIRPLTYRNTADGKHLWDWLGLDDARPLYNLYELVQRPEAPVLVVEGEKTADAARSLFPDRVVVTTAGGSGAAEKSDLSPLKGRSILIWPDNDEAGQKYLKSLVTLLQAQDGDADISVLPTPDVSPEMVEGKATLKPGFVAPEGWDAADAVDEGWTAEHIALLPKPMVQAIAAGFDEESQNVVHENFLVSAKGVFQVRSDKDGNEVQTKISSRILNLAQTCDELDNWGFLLSVTNPDGKQREWAMPRELLANPAQLKAVLYSMGADLHLAGDKDLLCDYLQAVKPTARARSVAKPGWTQNSKGNRLFVLPNQVIGQSQERVVFQSRDFDGHKTFGQSGDLATWKQEVAALCVGNSRLVMSISAALAGPLLHLLAEENGGFHFVGPSSMGKTTAVEMAASVWGRRDLFVKSWRTTDNALESTAVRHNDTILILDEISQVNPTQAGEVAYMLGNGKGKNRADKSGSAKAVSSWRTLFLSTGEKSLSEHMETGNKQALAGQEIRLINLSAEAGAGMGLFENIHGTATPQDFAGRIKKSTLESFGLAGPAFVKAILDCKSLKDVISEARQRMERFVGTNVPAEASGQVKRVAKRFGLLAVSGELAVQLGILPWEEGEATRGARACLQSWMESLGNLGNQESSQAVNQVRRFIEQYGESRFSPWKEQGEMNFSSGRTLNRAGFRRETDDGRTEYYVLPEVYKTEICHGLRPTEVTKALRERNLLVLGTENKSQRSERLPDLGTMKVYRIKPEILGDDNEFVS